MFTYSDKHQFAARGSKSVYLLDQASKVQELPAGTNHADITVTDVSLFSEAWTESLYWAIGISEHQVRSCHSLLVEAFRSY